MTAPDVPSKSPVAGHSMLLTFRASNVRSFRDEFELSFLSSTLSEPSAVRHVQWRQGGEPIGVVPVACIYGANASGKSNVLRAVEDMRTAVLRSFSSWAPDGGTRRRPFRLDPESQLAPSMFEVELVLNDVLHRYGFRFDDERILEEWAYRHPRGRPAMLFKRTSMRVDLGNSMPARAAAAIDLLRPNALFLSTAAAGGQSDLLDLYRWFSRNLVLAEADDRQARQFFTAELLAETSWKAQALALLRAADLGVTDVSMVAIDPKVRERMRKVMRVLMDKEDSEISDQALDPMRVRLHHRGSGDSVAFNLEEESLGTLVWLGLVGPIVDSLSRGSVLLADELDASLHPKLTAQIVRLFQDPKTNPRRAQILFNSHDTTLIDGDSDGRLLGRDQVWFSEKDNNGATRLYPLSDLAPRKDEAIAKRYLDGRYGALPIVADVDFTDVAELISSGAE